MTILYKTQAHASGGRAGTVKSADGLLDLRLAMPKSLGGKEDATNPEQLFAAGYASCFSNAILHVAREQKIAISDAPVTAEVGIGPSETGGFALDVSLTIELALPQVQAEQLVNVAHQVCPYSNATRNNIDVRLHVKGQ